MGVEAARASFDGQLALGDFSHGWISISRQPSRALAAQGSKQEALAHGPVAVNAQKQIARAAADPARVIELARALKY